MHHITSQLDEAELSEWYRAADCLVVTSYADGMNLVAKEFVAARADLGASVVLSEFAAGLGLLLLRAPVLAVAAFCCAFALTGWIPPASAFVRFVPLGLLASALMTAT